MKNNKIRFQFESKVWQHQAPDGWYFISVPKEITEEIRENLKWQEEGWGRMKATAEIGKTEWETAIWFDSKLNAYILPIKAIIRRKESIEIDMNIIVNIYI